MSINRSFDHMARWTSKAAGSPFAAAGAVILILVWAATGPIFHFSSNWQLVVNTGTTIITFLMVFFIQHSQNSDSASLHIKLDELIRSNKDSDNKMIDLDSLDNEELEKLRLAFARFAVDRDAAATNGDQTATKGLATEEPATPAAQENAPTVAPSPVEEPGARAPSEAR